LRTYPFSQINHSFHFPSIPWEHPADGYHSTDDEDIFQALARAFADKMPTLYSKDTCGNGLPSGIVHGAEMKGDMNAIMMDEVYQKYHSLMVSCITLTHGHCQKYHSLMVSDITLTHGHCQKYHSLMVIAKNTTHSWSVK